MCSLPLAAWLILIGPHTSSTNAVPLSSLGAPGNGRRTAPDPPGSQVRSTRAPATSPSSRTVTTPKEADRVVDSAIQPTAAGAARPDA